MPVTKSAKKALRRDRRRAVINQKTRQAYKEAVRMMRRQPSAENLVKAYSELDKAAKKKVIHKNKAARLKSRLAHFWAKPDTRRYLTKQAEIKQTEEKPKKVAKKISKAPLRPAPDGAGASEGQGKGVRR
jgi:small subunit ribosomal protein S20